MGGAAFLAGAVRSLLNFAPPMLPIAWSAEFPNDNPLLHEGAVWICTTVRGAPRAILRARASLPPPEPPPVVAELEPARIVVGPVVFVAEPEPPAVVAEPEPPAVVAEPEPPAVVAEPEPPAVVVEPELPPIVAESEPPLELVSSPPGPEPEPPDPFAEFVRAIADVVLESGATRAAAFVPSLFDRDEFGDDAFTGTALLLERGLLERGPRGLVPSAAFATTTAAWRRVLRGELADLTDCGSATLDQWASEIAAALIGAPAARSDDFRRQLRRRGVAAFGMLERAA